MATERKRQESYRSGSKSYMLVNKEDLPLVCVGLTTAHVCIFSASQSCAGCTGVICYLSMVAFAVEWEAC